VAVSENFFHAVASILENNLVPYVGNRATVSPCRIRTAPHSGKSCRSLESYGIEIKGSRDAIVEGNVAQDQPNVCAAFHTEFSENVVFRGTFVQANNSWHG
jgi:hypothetical protein